MQGCIICNKWIEDNICDKCYKEALKEKTEFIKHLSLDGFYKKRKKMTKITKKHDYQKEDEEKLVDMLYQTTLREYPGIPIPDEELAKELLRVGIQAKRGVIEGTILKDYLTKYNDEEIVKIWQEKMPLVTAVEFKAVHRQMLEQASELEKKLATTVKALKRITEIPDQEEYFDCEECISIMEEAAEQALAEIEREEE